MASIVITVTITNKETAMAIQRGYPLDMILGEFTNDAYSRTRKAIILAARRDPVLRRNWLAAKFSLDRRFKEWEKEDMEHDDGFFNIQNVSAEKAVALSIDWKPRWEDAPEFLSRPFIGKMLPVNEDFDDDLPF